MSTGKTTDSSHGQELPEVVPNTANGQNDSKDLFPKEAFEEKLSDDLRITPDTMTITSKEFWGYVWEALTLRYLRD